LRYEYDFLAFCPVPLEDVKKGDLQVKSVILMRKIIDKKLNI